MTRWSSTCQPSLQLLLPCQRVQGLELFTGDTSQFSIIQWETFVGENFRELVENKIFAEKTFVDCSLVLPVAPPEDATPLNFTEKTFTNSHKTSNVYSLESFLLYSIITLKCISFTITLPGLAVLILRMEFVFLSKYFSPLPTCVGIFSLASQSSHRQQQASLKGFLQEIIMLTK